MLLNYSHNIIYTKLIFVFIIVAVVTVKYTVHGKWSKETNLEDILKYVPFKFLKIVLLVVVILYGKTQKIMQIALVGQSLGFK